MSTVPVMQERPSTPLLTSVADGIDADARVVLPEAEFDPATAGNVVTIAELVAVSGESTPAPSVFVALSSVAVADISMEAVPVGHCKLGASSQASQRDR